METKIFKGKKARIRAEGKVDNGETRKSDVLMKVVEEAKNDKTRYPIFQ